MPLLVGQPLVDIGRLVAGRTTPQAVFAFYRAQAVSRAALGELVQGPGQIISAGEPAGIESQVRRPALRPLLKVNRVVQRIVAIDAPHDALGMNVEGMGQRLFSGQVEAAVAELLRRNDLAGALRHRAAFRVGMQGQRFIDPGAQLTVALRAVLVTRLADGQQPLVEAPVGLEHKRIPLPAALVMQQNAAGRQSGQNQVALSASRICRPSSLAGGR